MPHLKLGELTGRRDPCNVRAVHGRTGLAGRIPLDALLD